MKRTLILALLAATALPLGAEEPVDLGMMTRIRDEGLHHSQVMETLFQLTDVIGPRLTGSPQAKQANEWTRDQFARWGLANAHLEGYPFGRGWSYSATQVRLTSPRTALLLAYPRAWNPGTNGPVRGPALRVKIESEKDFDQYRGKLAGKILLLDDAQEFKEPEEPSFQRYSREDLEKLEEFGIESRNRDRGDYRKAAIERWRLRNATNEFLEKEKALATVEASGRVNGVIRVTSGASWMPGQNVGIPGVVMAAEHYNELIRLLDHDQPVEIEIDVAARFLEDDLQAYDTLAEIPGTDKKDELVMAGAHLDSWHAGTGATDNAAGSAVVMEAARILKALGVKPRRTIRFALWTGEEQGYYGSLAYVKKHFASRPENTDPAQQDLPDRYRESAGPLQLKPEHAKVAAYFNLDKIGRAHV